MICCRPPPVSVGRSTRSMAVTVPSKIVSYRVYVWQSGPSMTHEANASCGTKNSAAASHRKRIRSLAAGLFVMERLHRIEACGTHRGVQPEDEADTHRHDERQ